MDLGGYYEKCMHKAIKKYLESRIGKYSFFFEDLKSGYVYGYNENVSMTAAGCMKLPIAVSLIKAVEDKKIDFMDKIKIETSDKVYGTGIIHEFNEREYTVFELMVIMLIQSDNTAANKIIDILGMQQINEDIIAMGLKNTRLNRKTNDERTAITDVENITTAYDLNDTEYLELPKGKFAFTVLSQDIPNSVYGTVSLAKCGKMMWDGVMNNWN